jgi:hypothetical protein
MPESEHIVSRSVKGGHKQRSKAKTKECLYLLLGPERFHGALELLVGPTAQDLRVDGLDGEILAKDRVRPLVHGPEEAVAKKSLSPDGYDVREGNCHRPALNGSVDAVSIVSVRVGSRRWGWIGKRQDVVRRAVADANLSGCRREPRSHERIVLVVFASNVDRQSLACLDEQRSRTLDGEAMDHPQRPVQRRKVQWEPSIVVLDEQSARTLVGEALDHLHRRLTLSSKVYRQPSILLLLEQRLGTLVCEALDH